MVEKHLNLERWWQQMSSADLRKEFHNTFLPELDSNLGFPSSKEYYKYETKPLLNCIKYAIIKKILVKSFRLWIFRRAETACPEDWKLRVQSIGNRFQRIVREALIAKNIVCPT